MLNLFPLHSKCQIVFVSHCVGLGPAGMCSISDLVLSYTFEIDNPVPTSGSGKSKLHCCKIWTFLFRKISAEVMTFHLFAQEALTHSSHMSKI